ncbi:AAA family ATPase [Azospirillum sp.]|uniref:AAA family ATPase n=1 Tax=Azospirillum sp. TaxID=34012 RepID=UPI002D3E86D3|nr:AAA family ATPase [Azospirillum sp.]HYF87134.1 AAA family ATPase [Azospirillum sp.]
MPDGETFKFEDLDLTDVTPATCYVPNLPLVRAYVETLHHRASTIRHDGKLVAASYGEQPDGRLLPPIVGHFSVGAVDAMVEFIMDLSDEPHRNVYASLAVFRPDLPSGKKGGEADIVASLGLVADFDDLNAAGYRDRLPLNPDCVLETSAGRYQAVYWFGVPVMPDKAKALAVALKQRCGCDHGTADVSHVWRIPGTYNWPNRKKLNDGRPSLPQRVRWHEELDDHSTEPEDLKKALGFSDARNIANAMAPFMPDRLGMASLIDTQRDVPAIISQLPDWLIREITTGRTAKQERSGENDRSEAVHHVVAELRERGCPPSDIVAVIAAHPAGIGERFNGDMVRIVADVSRCFQKGEASAGSLKATVADWGASELGVPAISAATASTMIQAWPVEPFAPENLPPRCWVYGHFLSRGNASMLTADGGVGKSLKVLIMAVSIASGRDLLGVGVKEVGPVWLVSIEDDEDELRRRLAAVLNHYSMSWNDLNGNLHWTTFYNSRFLVAHRDRNGNITIVTPLVNDVIAEAQRIGAVAVIVDPLVETHAANENSNEEMAVVLSAYRHIARGANCAVCVVHHTSKANAGGTEGVNHMGRGAGSITASIRHQASLLPTDAETAKKYGLSDGERLRLVRLVEGKNNQALSGGVYWFRKVTIVLRNGDTVGVLEPFDITQLEHERRRERERAAEPEYRNIAEIIARAMIGSETRMGDMVGIVCDALGVKERTAGERITASIPLAPGVREVCIDGTNYRLWRRREGSHAKAPVTIVKVENP